MYMLHGLSLFHILFFWQLVLISFYVPVIIFKMYQSCCSFKHWKSIIMKWNMLISKFWCHRERERGKEGGGQREILFLFSVSPTCSVLIGFCSIQLIPCFGFYVIIFCFILWIPFFYRLFYVLLKTLTHLILWNYSILC